MSSPTSTDRLSGQKTSHSLRRPPLIGCHWADNECVHAHTNAQTQTHKSGPLTFEVSVDPVALFILNCWVCMKKYINKCSSDVCGGLIWWYVIRGFKLVRMIYSLLSPHILSLLYNCMIINWNFLGLYYTMSIKVGEKVSYSGCSKQKWFIF